MNKKNKIIVYVILMFSFLCCTHICFDNVHAYPGNENITLASVSDARVSPEDYVVWNMTVLNNSTSWVNVTFTYNTTTKGPYNLTIGTGGIVISNHTVPNTYGNYTVNISSKAAVQNQTIIGFIVDHYLIDLTTSYTEVEAGLNTLISATGTSVIDGHEITYGDSLIVEGVSLTWSNYTDSFHGATTKSTPQTVTYDTVTSFSEDTYDITSAEINTTVTVTWSTDMMDRVQEYLITGNWAGGIINELLIPITITGGYTFIMLMFSVALWQHSGPYATIIVWFFGWGIFATQVHGVALAAALGIFVLGVSALFTQVFIDRRNS